MSEAVKNRYIAANIERAKQSFLPRDVRAYLTDVVESCDAVTSALARVDLEAFQANRLVRSAIRSTS